MSDELLEFPDSPSDDINMSMHDEEEQFVEPEMGFGDSNDDLDDEANDEEYVPEKKVLAAKRNKPRKAKVVKKHKNVGRGRKKLNAPVKEKENQSERLSARVTPSFRHEEIDTRIFQKSLAPRVPMPDPLKETNCVPTEIPVNVKKVKLVISSKERKLLTSMSIPEPVTQLKEVDPNSLKSGSSKGALRASKRKKHNDPVAFTSIKSRPRRKAAPRHFSEHFDEGADANNIFGDESFQEDDFKQEVPEDGLVGQAEEEEEGVEEEEEGDQESYFDEDFSLAMNEETLDDENDEVVSPEVEEEVVAGPEEETLDLMEPENDYEDFWANSSSKDTLEKKQMEIRLKRKDAKYLDDYVVIDSQRKKRKSRTKKPSKNLFKTDADADADDPDEVDHFEDEVDLGEDGDWKPESGLKNSSHDEDDEADFKFQDPMETEEIHSDELATTAKIKLKKRKRKIRKATPSSHDKIKGAPTDRKIYGCLFCEFMGRKQAWLMHLKTDHGEKELVYCSSYKTCQMPFENEEQLKAHIEATHEKKHICEYEGCGRLFKQKSTLREHRRTHFPDGIDPEEPQPESSVRQADRSYVCTFCGKKYRTRNGFRAHEAMVHTRKLKHKCSQEGCTAAFFYYSELAIHTRKHTGELPFTCSYCGARYISHATLAQHERAAHLQTEDTECQICHKKLRKRNLPGHLKTHEGYDGIPCTVCGKEFPTIGGKNRHEKIHFEVKSHTCRFCGKSFVQRANMVAHERIHTGERPYKCKHCNEGFPQQTRRNQHEQTCKHRVLSSYST